MYTIALSRPMVSRFSVKTLKTLFSEAKMEVAYGILTASGNTAACALYTQLRH